MTLDDERWTDLLGGYRLPYDPRPALRALQERGERAAMWEDLWENLHHQGDVDLASYAAVPLIVQASAASGDWNAYALVATIELARAETHNPPLPAWLEADYRAAVRDLAGQGLRALGSATDEALTTSIIAVIALDRGLPALARTAMLNEAERGELLASAGWG